APVSYRTPTVPLTSIFRTLLRRATNPTGCLRPPAISYSGCERICPVKPFSMANTGCRQLSKHNDAAYESAFAYIRFSHGRGVGARPAPPRLLLATPREHPLKKGNPQSRVRRWPHPDQYPLHGASRAFCQSPPRARLRLEFDDYWREPRHAPY